MTGRLPKPRDFRIMKMLAKVASDIAPVKNARMAAAIYVGNDLISLGINQRKTHPLQKRFETKEQCGALIHAEIAALAQGLRRISMEDMSKATLYVCREKYDNAPSLGGKKVWGMAKPCPSCSAAISSFGIREVKFTCDDGSIETVRMHD